MRTPKYYSPTSIAKFYEDRTEFYLKYLADNRPPRIAQTPPMSIGSAFDAYIKAYLSEKLFGEIRDGFGLEELFETQVESHNRDWAWTNGEYVFNCYKSSGALASLMLELEDAMDEPRFEFTVTEKIVHESCTDGITLLGKPDLYFTTKDRIKVILDWKVNGYCGKSATSPAKGYVRIVDGWNYERAKPSRGAGTPHKNADVMMDGGIEINISISLEEANASWGMQTSIYGWLTGEAIGSQFITAIDQIVAKPVADGRPLLRIASHRCYITPEFQEELYQRIVQMDNTIKSGHIFDDQTREASDEQCKILDVYHDAFKTDSDDPKEQWFNESCRG